jgi:hypothetical protein
MKPGTCLPRLARELARILACHQVPVELPAGEIGRRLRQLAPLGAQYEVHASPLVVCERFEVAGIREFRDGWPSSTMGISPRDNIATFLGAMSAQQTSWPRWVRVALVTSPT